MTSPLDRLLNPRTLAVIGASRDPNKYGSWAIQHTVDYGFTGRIYGINRSATDADLGRRPAPLVATLDDIDGDIDCAMITLPGPSVLGAVEQCAERGVPYVIVPSTGFGESGEEGRKSQEALLAVAKAAGMRLLGPNCFGLQSASGRVNLTPWEIPTGPIGIASQSGSVAIALHQQAQLVRTGFSACMGIGNQIDVSFGDALEHFAIDDETKAVALYVEGMPPQHLDRFLAGLDACRDAGKLVAIIKAGQTAESAMVAATHTGSLAGDSEVWRRVVESHGAVCVNSPDVLMDVLQAAVRAPKVGPNVFVIADGGGDTALAADAVSLNGFRLATLSEQTLSRLEPLVPPAAPRVRGLNPLTADTPGGVEDDPRLLAKILDVVRTDPAVDLMLISGVFGGYGYLRELENETVSLLLQMHHEGPPIAVHSAYALDGQEPVEALKSGGISVYPSMERLLSAFATRRTGEATQIAASPVVNAPSRQLPFVESVAMLAKHGISTVPAVVVRTEAELIEGARAIGYPVVVKLADPDIIHKSDVAGVALNLASDDDALAAGREMWSRLSDSPLVVMKMAEPGFEVLLGVTHDSLFGPVVMVGRGGIWTEVERDVALLPTPFTREQAATAIRSLRCAPMLTGHRGRPELDINSIADLAVKLSDLALNEDIDGVDLNPTVLYSDGCAVVDVRIIASATGGELGAPLSAHCS